jgi:uncharacterized protein involved in exopolysaccharide biosynthesis
VTDNPTQHAGARGRARGGKKRTPLWWLLPTGALLGAVAGGAYGVVRTPQYTATSYVVAVPSDRADAAAALGFAQAYGRVATQLAVLADAQIGVGMSVAALRESVRVESSPDAPMVAVSATSTSPGQAADIANSVSRALVTHAGLTRGTTGIGLVRLSRALRPTEPSSLSPQLGALVGGSAGGLLGGLALLARPRRVADDDTGRAPVPGPAVAAEAGGTLA